MANGAELITEGQALVYLKDQYTPQTYGMVKKFGYALEAAEAERDAAMAVIANAQDWLDLVAGAGVEHATFLNPLRVALREFTSATAATGVGDE